MKKRLLYSGVVLLAGILALAGCSSPLDDAAIEAQDNGSAGRVQILINGESGVRTLAPTTLGGVSYQVFYRPTGSGYANQDEDEADALSFALGVGIWDIRVLAKIGATDVAEGIETSVNVVGGKTSTVAITLAPNPKGENGTFHYELDYSGIQSVAKGYLTLTPYPYTTENIANDSTVANGSGEIHIALEDSNLGDPNHDGVVSGDIALPAGIYTLDVRLTTIRGGYDAADPAIVSGDDHTNDPKDETTIDTQNVDIHKTEIVYIYSGQTTNMAVANYTFSDQDLAKLYFKGTLDLYKTHATTITYKPIAMEVQYKGRVLNVYTANNATETVSSVKMLNDSSPNTNIAWNWEEYVPSYELEEDLTSLESEIDLVFTLQSDTGSGGKKLYTSETVVFDDAHGTYNTDIDRVIRSVELYVNDDAYSSASPVIFTVESYKYNEVPTGTNWYYYSGSPPPSYTNLESHNLDVISGSQILVTVERKANTTFIPNMQATYDTEGISTDVRDIIPVQIYRTSTSFNKLFYQYEVPEDLSTYGSEELDIKATVLLAGALVPANNGEKGYVISINGGWDGGTYTVAKEADRYAFVEDRYWGDIYAAADDDTNGDGLVDSNDDSKDTTWELPTIVQLEEMVRVIKPRLAVGVPYWSNSEGYQPGLNSWDPYIWAGYLYKISGDTNYEAPTSSYVNGPGGYADRYVVTGSNPNANYGWATGYSSSSVEARTRLVKTIDY
jgi:hypothetical protein